MAIDATNATWLKPFNEIRRVADDGVWGDILAPRLGATLVRGSPGRVCAAVPRVRP